MHIPIRSDATLSELAWKRFMTMLKKNCPTTRVEGYHRKQEKTREQNNAAAL
jgi:deoxyribodipyrimidine photolyase